MKQRRHTRPRKRTPCRFIHTEAKIGAANIPRSKATIWLERFIAVKCVCMRARAGQKAKLAPGKWPHLLIYLLIAEPCPVCVLLVYMASKKTEHTHVRPSDVACLCLRVRERDHKVEEKSRSSQGRLDCIVHRAKFYFVLRTCRYYSLLCVDFGSVQRTIAGWKTW